MNIKIKALILRAYFFALFLTFLGCNDMSVCLSQNKNKMLVKFPISLELLVR